MNISLGTFLVDLQTATTDVFASLAPVVYLILGMLLAFFVMQFVINLLRGDSGGDIMDE